MGIDLSHLREQLLEGHEGMRGTVGAFEMVKRPALDHSLKCHTMFILYSYVATLCKYECSF